MYCHHSIAKVHLYCSSIRILHALLPPHTEMSLINTSVLSHIASCGIKLFFNSISFVIDRNNILLPKAPNCCVQCKGTVIPPHTKAYTRCSQHQWSTRHACWCMRALIIIAIHMYTNSAITSLITYRCRWRIRRLQTGTA